MATPRRAASSFVDDRHVLYAGWALGHMIRSGLPVEPVYTDDGIVTNRITVHPPLGGDNPPVITLIIPPPPDDWKFNP